MKIMKPILPVAVATLLTACNVGPDYVRPTAAVPAAFGESAPWRVAQPRDNAQRGPWWHIYEDPRLNGLMEQVTFSNQSLKAAEATYRQARALVQAAASGYYPQVSAGALLERARSNSSNRSGTSSNYLLSAAASWELDLWGRVRRSVEASRADAQASAADLESLRLSIQAELVGDYFQLRTIDAQKRLLDETVSSYGQYLELTRNRHAAGVASPADVFQAETQLRSSQAQAIDLGVERAHLEHAIALLIGRAPAEFTLTPIPLDGTPPPSPPGLPSRLLERRPDIAAAERRVAAANARIGVATAAYYPAITLSSSAGFASSSLSNWLSWPGHVWALGSAIAQTVYDGGLRGAQVDEARATYEATVADYRQTVLTAFQEVEDNLAALRILEQEAAAQDQALRAARQSLAITTNQYRAGIVGYLNVIVAQTTALELERDSVDLMGRRMAASVKLVKGIGGGWNAADLAEIDGKGQQ
jgi:NodT family efflux transporter outer membrane factor (OMF) lipoprotein